jgi:16S rRNA (cytidine1402-2'-O)-methyltransferase
MHEEVVRGTLATLQEYCSKGVRGEVCLVIAPLPEAKAEDRTVPASVLDLITELVHRGMSRRDAAAKLTEHTDLSKKQAYQVVLDLPSTPTTDDPEPS